MVEKHLVFWEYNTLCVAGVQGVSSLSLEEIFAHYGRQERFELAPLFKGKRSEYLVGFEYGSPLILRMRKSGKRMISVVSGIDKEKVKGLMESVVSDVSLSPREPSNAFIEELANGGHDIADVYDWALSAAERKGGSVRQLFGAVSYYNFLSSYQRWNKEEARKWALQVFGLPQNFRFDLSASVE